MRHCNFFILVSFLTMFGLMSGCQESQRSIVDGRWHVLLPTLASSSADAKIVLEQVGELILADGQYEYRPLKPAETSRLLFMNKRRGVYTVTITSAARSRADLQQLPDDTQAARLQFDGDDLMNSFIVVVDRQTNKLKLMGAVSEMQIWEVSSDQ